MLILLVNINTMVQEEWDRLYPLLQREYQKFHQAHIDITKARTNKLRKLAIRCTIFTVGRVEYHICNRPDSSQLLNDYLLAKSCDKPAFFEPSCFLTEMPGFLELVKQKTTPEP